MRDKRKQLHRIYRVGGRSFHVYLDYDEQLGESFPAYPDFEKSPQYTSQGKPFATAEQDACPYAKAKGLEGIPENCGGCAYFFREHTPYDPIGICMNGRWIKGTENVKKEHVAKE